MNLYNNAESGIKKWEREDDFVYVDFGGPLYRYPVNESIFQELIARLENNLGAQTLINKNRSLFQSIQKKMN